MVISLLASCDFLPEDIQFCTVEFYVEDELYSTHTTILGQPTPMPATPTKENHIFVGWYLEGKIARYSYDFSTPVVVDIELHARFTPDAEKITNMLTLETMKSVVTVLNKCYNTGLGGIVEIESATSQGSGVIIDISDGYCFVLTNYHVTTQTEGYAHQQYIVEDAWGNQYKAIAYKNASIASYASSPEYDLALLFFKYEKDEKYPLQEIEMASDPKIGDFTISLGSPQNQKNAITYGEVLAYQMLEDSEEGNLSNLNFEIIYHNALIYHGSSGGPLLNAEGHLVGLNFAGFETNMYGCAIPLSKIIEFLDKYVYVK